MKLTRKLIAAMLSVCMVLALLTSAASAANIKANLGPASYSYIAVTNYSRMLSLENGGVVVASSKTGEYGLIDLTGKVVVPFQYTYMWALDGGLFAVGKEGGEGTSLGVINAKGKVLLALSDDCAGIDCRNGIISVTTRTERLEDNYPSYDYKTNYYTTDWKPSTEEDFWRSDYSDDINKGDSGPLAQYNWYYAAGDYYVVGKYSDYKYTYGLLNSKYEIVIPLGVYDGISPVGRGDRVAFEVSKGGQYKLVDASNKDIVAFGVYDGIWESRDSGILYVYKGAQRGAIDITGQVLVPLGEHEVGYMTEDGYISAVTGNTSSMLFKDGKLVKRYTDKRVTTLPYASSHFMEQYDGSRYSIVDLDGKVIVPESTEPIEINSSYSGLSWGLGSLVAEAELYDNYTKSILSFLSKTDSGWVTTFADYKTGEVKGQLSGVRASNINDEGWFVYQNADGLYGFGRMEGAGFLDIIPGHWAEKAVDWAVNGGKEITNGVGNGKFNPDAQCTNAMILTFLWRAAGKPASTAQLPIDITGKKIDYAESALRWAAEKGMISKGFDPNAACTSASAVKFIWQAFDSPKPKGGSTFTDVPASADYAAAVAWAEQLGITQGEGNHIFSPGKVCSRGRILTFLYRAYVEEARLK